MRALTDAASRRAARDDNTPLVLLQIDFTSPSALTLRLADRPVRAIGYDWLPLVASWGALTSSLEEITTGGRPASFDVTLINSVAVEGTGKSRLSDLIRSPLNMAGAREWGNAKATLYYLIDESLSAGDELKLGVFYVEDPSDIGEDTMVVRMSAIDLLIEDKMSSTVITATDFPNADSNDIGKVIPVIFGQLTNVPTLRAIAPHRTKLSAPLGYPSADGTVPVNSTTGYPASGTIQVDQEKIIYSSKTASAFIISSRGAFTTAATSHVKGAEVVEVISAYTYIVGENVGNFKTTSITNVKIADSGNNAGWTANLDDTTLVTGKSFATITFNVVPSVVATQSSTRIVQTLSGSPVPLYYPYQGVPGGQNVLIGTITPPQLDSSYAINSVTRVVTVQVTQIDGAGFDNGLKIWDPTTGRVWANWPNSSRATILATGPVTTSYVTGASLAAENFYYYATSVSNAHIAIQVSTYAVTIDATQTTTAYSSTIQTLLGDITCDAQGLKDDALGTISGSPNLLLQNPTDVTRLIVGYLFKGVTPASDFGASWATTRALHSGGAYKWDFVLERPIKFSAFRQRASEQARSLMYVDSGKIEFKYLANIPPVDVTFDYLRDVHRDAPASAARTERAKVSNSLTVYSQRDYRKGGSLGEQYVRSNLYEDLSVFSDAMKADLELSHVQDAATADALGNFWVGQRKMQHFRVPLVGWWNVAHVQLGDGFAVQNHPVLAAHGDTGVVFRVLEVSRPSGNFHRVALVGVEVASSALPRNPDSGEDMVFNCRLTYVSATQIRLDPSNGNQVRVQNASGWQVYTIPNAGVSWSAGGLLANTNYYVYLYDSGGNVLALELSTTTHARDASTGIETKSGDTTRTLVGMVRTNGSSQFVNSATQRWVLNWHNRIPLPLVAEIGINVSNSAIVATAVGGTRIEFLTWSDVPVEVGIDGSLDVADDGVTTADTFTSVMIDGSSNTADFGFTHSYAAQTGNFFTPFALFGRRALSEGYHYAELGAYAASAKTYSIIALSKCHGAVWG